MGLFGWLKRRPSALMPESLWVVEIEDGRCTVADQKGQTRSVALSELDRVIIETNDTGPWGADFWWLLFERDGNLACAFPQGATGEKEAMDTFMALPGFDHGQLGQAIRSTNNALFTVWQSARPT